MIQLAYYLIMILIAFWIGFSVVIYSKQLEEKWIPKSFLTGIAIIIIVSFWVSNFSAGGLRSIACIVVSVLLLLAAVGIYRRRNDAIKYFKMITIYDMIKIIGCILAGTLPMTISLFYGAQQLYNDGYTYICNADYLLDFGYNVAIDPLDMKYHPWLSQMFMYQDHHFRIGAQMLLALFSGFFRASLSIELFLPVTSLGMFMCGVSAWTFDAKKYMSGKFAEILTILLMVLNVPIIFCNAMYGFLPQLMGSALCLASVISICNSEKWNNNRWWNVITTAICISALALTYNEMLPFFAMVVLMFMARNISCNKLEGKRIIIDILCCALFSMVSIIIYIPGMIHAILFMLGTTVGWDQNRDIFTYLSYFFSTVPAEYSFMFAESRMLNYLFEGITLLVFSFIILGWNKSNKIVKADFVCISLPYLLMFLYFAVFSVNPFVGGKGNSWSIYKLMQYYFVVLVPFLAVFIERSMKEMHKLLSYAFILIFLFFNAFNAINYVDVVADNMRIYVGKEDNPLEEYYKLYDKYGDSKEVLALFSVPIKHRQMITYFLKDVRLISDWETDDYYSAIPLVQEQDYENSISLIYDLNNPGNIAGMAEASITITPMEGFYEQEMSGNNYWRWSRKESEILVNRYDDISGTAVFEGDLTLFQQTGASERIEIFGNGTELIKEVPIEPGEMVHLQLQLGKEIESLKFVFSGSESVPSENDSRNIAFALYNYEIYLQ